MLLYASTILLSSFLLFQVQPMIAKMILPWFGGSAAVWITAMLFFQLALLAGYLYAHWLVKKLSARLQAMVHGGLLLLSLLLLPVAPSAGWKPAVGAEPFLGILGVLTASVGLPYFLLSTTSPLVQAWYGARYRSAVPYRLFGLSNLASLLGLLAYPVLVEPLTTLRQQSLAWSFGYGAFAVLALAAALVAARRVPGRPGDAGRPDVMKDDAAVQPGFGVRVRWFLLAACGSTLLLAVTNHLTQNVASIPFLWVLPLGLYLLTFIITFDFEGLYRRGPFLWLALAALGAMAFGMVKWNSHTDIRLVIGTFSAALFAVCLFCHGELVAQRPASRYLTSFYLMLSLGGASGGLLIGLAAPKLLPGYFELPLALAGIALLLLTMLDYRSQRIAVAAAWAVAVVVVAAGYNYYRSYRASSIDMDRNFYGSLRVYTEDAGTEDEVRSLVHGTVDHGLQFTAPGRSREHTTYYGPDSGVALALGAVRRSPVRVGIIGLGAGSLATFARDGDLFRFYEINPLVETFARRDFTYLAAAAGAIEVVLGDGRLSLEQEADGRFDLIAVDAFSGDAIPVHLLTREALQLYFQKLAPGGIVALHITNTHLDLQPVVAAAAADLGVHAVLISNDRDSLRRVYRADWALLSRRPVRDWRIERAAQELAASSQVPVWTDDHSNLFRILKR